MDLENAYCGRLYRYLTTPMISSMKPNTSKAVPQPDPRKWVPRIVAIAIPAIIRIIPTIHRIHECRFLLFEVCAFSLILEFRLPFTLSSFIYKFN